MFYFYLYPVTYVGSPPPLANSIHKFVFYVCRIDRRCSFG